jgi:hypothetical protein
MTNTKFPVWVKRKGRTTSIDWRAVNAFNHENYSYDPEEHRDHQWGSFDVKDVYSELPEFVFNSESDRHLLLTVFNDWFTVDPEPATNQYEMLGNILSDEIKARKLQLSSLYGAFAVKPPHIIKGDGSV